MAFSFSKKKSGKGSTGALFGGKRAAPFGKKKDQGKSAPAQKNLRAGRAMSGGGR